MGLCFQFWQEWQIYVLAFNLLNILIFTPKKCVCLSSSLSDCPNIRPPGDVLRPHGQEVEHPDLPWTARDSIIWPMIRFTRGQGMLGFLEFEICICDLSFLQGSDTDSGEAAHGWQG